MYDGSSFDPIDYPDAEQGSIAYDINDSRFVVGDYWEASTPTGFLYDGFDYQSIAYPPASRTKLRGINNSGHMVGFWEIYGGGAYQGGFYFDGSNYLPFDHPDATYYTTAEGINDAGHVVGNYRPDPGNHPGFHYDGENFTDIEYPGAFRTFVYDINNHGDIVGMYVEDNEKKTQHGFLYDGVNFTKIEPPETAAYSGALYSSWALGINDRGVIVGSFTQEDRFSGFIASTAISVEIDIKPSSDPNAVNPSAGGYVAVSILTTSVSSGDASDFDATQVDPDSIAFGPSGVAIARPAKVKDVDRDGDADLILHFKISDTGITCGDAEATLTGQTFAGDAIQGTDSLITRCN